MNIQGSVSIKKGKDHAIRRLHPWIFSGAIQQTRGDLVDGCWVEILNHQGKVLGFGHYQTGSIAVRILSFGEAIPGESFWVNKINQGINLRQTAGLPSEKTNAFRLIHGEGDGLPGLVVDYYNKTAVIQAHSSGMHLDRHYISQALREAWPSMITSVFYKSQSSLPGKLSNDRPDEYLFGDGIVPHVILENGLQFNVDWESGQKTGFFLDQRENRKLLGSFCKGKNVLNTFCYSGAFSVYAIDGHAKCVHSVDSSARAIELTRQNIIMNGYRDDTHACYVQDTFDFLKDKQDQYDIIVLDPPAFAKHRDARHQAVKGYQRLNAEALRAVKAGGIILTFSCSQVVDRKLFYDTVISAALQSGRQVKVLHHLSQPADHPVSMYHPEGEYLKGLVLYVE